MDLTRDPNQFDIKVLMKSASFWPKVADGSPKDIYALEQSLIGVSAAVDQWQHLTGYTPYHSSEEDGKPENALVVPYSVNARQFSQNGILRLENGMIRLDEVRINGSVAAAGSVITRPTHAPMQRRPYSWLYFPHFQRYGVMGGSYPLSIVVKGRFGFCTVYRADVWQQILQAGALIALTQTENLQNIASIGIDGFNKAFDTVGVIAQKDILNTWGKNFLNSAESHRRQT
jgi:hypothetical protein